MPKEVKSQPLAEKKAPGKKPTGLGAPSGPTSTVDTYEKLLSSIPEFADFGKLFKVIGIFYSFNASHCCLICYTSLGKVLAYFYFYFFCCIYQSSAPVELTEAETEYAVNVVKHIYDRHVVFQYNCTNTVPEQLLENVRINLKKQFCKIFLYFIIGMFLTYYFCY